MFNNTTFNNNYNKNQPLNTIQNQFKRNIPNFEQFLNDAEQYTVISIAATTKNAFQSNFMELDMVVRFSYHTTQIKISQVECIKLLFNIVVECIKLLFECIPENISEIPQKNKSSWM